MKFRWSARTAFGYRRASQVLTPEPISPPWAKYVAWPSSAISVCQSDATARLFVPSLTGACEKPKPGNEGTMTSKERKPGSPLLAGSVSIGMILYISTNEPGHPCVSTNGAESGSTPLTCRWGISRPSEQLKTSSEIRKGRVGNANGKRSDFHGYSRAAASDELSFSSHLLVAS